MENLNHKESICCTLSTSQMEDRKKILQRFQQLVIEKTGVENGYQFEFKGNKETLNQIMEIIKLERQCCSFLTFQLTVQKESNPLFLKITGPEGTKDFLIHELGF